MPRRKARKKRTYRRRKKDSNDIASFFNEAIVRLVEIGEFIIESIGGLFSGGLPF